MLKEFREFIAKGNVLDLAIGVVIGAAFGKITTALVNDILMPPIGLLLAGVDLKDAKWVLKAANEAAKQPEVAITYGSFLQVVIEFMIIAWVLFLVVKAANHTGLMRKKEE
ncbi:large conductance mechanosensitive channel protein MscL [Siphonobacter curvatus]|uniref:Large-conductance mechanosensitive channel n=1 Tax=Siphonobacter curvatus TaxID=2094562 RepID=A0A2S7ISA6_9BACT|nr:large conductance mechanosensitive channel protein MscL [Siphonobacter curvatus]PQA60518.1 large conductance mechanosensitive channel protein MscL [Siphonobacter curvatus]